LPANQSTPSPGPQPPARPLRADARRNRDALVDAARAALASDSAEFTLEGVARDAGVGIGTLYRHFPTRPALVEAVYSAELADLADSAATLLDELEPDAALRAWVHRYARFTATKRGMMDTLRAGLAEGTITASSTRERLTAAIAPLLAAGARAGTVRADVEPGDVLALLLGASLATAADRTTERTERLLVLALDALRPPPGR